MKPISPREPGPSPHRQIAMESRRLTLTTPPAGTQHTSSMNLPEGGRLGGLEVFVDTPDTGDYISLTLQDRLVVDKLLVDLAPRTSYEKKFLEPAERGDLLTLTYFSAGSSTKNATWTPTLLRPALKF